jgi:hypothetical protein
MDGIPGLSNPLRAIHQLLAMSNNDAITFISKDKLLVNLRNSFPLELIKQYEHPLVHFNKQLPAFQDSAYTLSSQSLCKGLIIDNRVQESRKLKYFIHGKNTTPTKPGIIGTFGLFVFLLALIRLDWFQDLVGGYDSSSSESSDNEPILPPLSANLENTLMANVRDFDCSWYCFYIDNSNNSKRNFNQRFRWSQKGKEYWIWPKLFVNNLGEGLNLPNFRRLELGASPAPSPDSEEDDDDDDAAGNQLAVVDRCSISNLLDLPQTNKSLLFPTAMTNENPVLHYGLFEGEDC